MNAQNLATSDQHTRPRGVRSDVPEEIRKNVPTLDEIHRRALEIHIERGGHGCDLDNYLDEWLQAERERRARYRHDAGGDRVWRPQKEQDDFKERRGPIGRGETVEGLPQ
jgi:hypothetical protein